MTIQQQHNSLTALQGPSPILCFGPQSGRLMGPPPGITTLVQFLAMLPPFPTFTFADFHSESSGDAAACLLHLARICPRLEDLTVRCLHLIPPDLLSLTPCKALKKVFLYRVSGLTAVRSAFFCERIPSLRKLSVFECQEFTRNLRGKALPKLLKARGITVNVEVADCERESEQCAPYGSKYDYCEEEEVEDEEAAKERRSMAEEFVMG